MGRCVDVVGVRCFTVLRRCGIGLVFAWLFFDPAVIQSITQTVGAAMEVVRHAQLLNDPSGTHRKETEYGNDLNGRP